MIWLHTLGDSHSTQFQGPIGSFSGELLQLIICFQLGVFKLISDKWDKQSITMFGCRKIEIVSGCFNLF